MEVVGDQISEIVNRDLFFVKDLENWSSTKSSDKFDVYDPVSKEILVHCREPELNSWTKFARLWGKNPGAAIGLDTMAPFNYAAILPDGDERVLRITRGNSTFSVGGAPVQFFDHEDNLLCRTEKIMMCLGLKYGFVDPKGKLLFMVQVKNSSGKTSFLANGSEIGSVNCRWQGDHSSFFKQRFKHAISISPDVPQYSLQRTVLFGLGLCYYRAMG